MTRCSEGGGEVGGVVRESGRESTDRGGATESGEIPNRSGDHDDRSRVAPWIHHVPQQKDPFFFVVVGVVLQTHEQRLDIGEMTKQLICWLAGWMDEFECEIVKDQ
ncbi:hypothetical protein Droror1_Dr00008288 [Drosera rotundifolia]